MSPEQIARDIVDGLERERGVLHFNDKEELIRRFAQALLDAETRGLANGTLCTVPAKDLPFIKTVEAAFPSDTEIRDYFQWSKDVKATTPAQAFEVMEWLKSELLSRLGGNKK